MPNPHPLKEKYPRHRRSIREQRYGRWMKIGGADCQEHPAVLMASCGKKSTYTRIHRMSKTTFRLIHTKRGADHVAYCPKCHSFCPSCRRENAWDSLRTEGARP